jgi:hypothetical protein
LTKKVISFPIAILLLLYGFPIRAQVGDSISAAWSLSAYADVYYATYSDSVGIGNYQKFPTVSPRSNSFGLNVLQLVAQYDGDKVRAMAAVHFGDIPASTWSANYNVIEEAHAGVKICKSLWLDAGFFRTHFGTEFLLPKENITSSIAVNTYYEPYFESGFRLNYDPTKRLEINLFLLNGYGIFEDNNKKKSLGLGITYVLNDKSGVGYTNYIGDDSPDSSAFPQMRFHNNIFYNYQGPKLKIQIGADYCFQQNADLATGHKTATMYSGVATIKYQVKPKAAIYARGEVFQDPDGYMSKIIIDDAGKKTGYKLWGITAGLEYKPTDNSYIRLEGRRLQMDDNQAIFRDNGKSLTFRNELMVNMGVNFDILKGSETRKKPVYEPVLIPDND